MSGDYQSRYEFYYQQVKHCKEVMNKLTQGNTVSLIYVSNHEDIKGNVQSLYKGSLRIPPDRRSDYGRKKSMQRMEAD